LFTFYPTSVLVPLTFTMVSIFPIRDYGENPPVTPAQATGRNAGTSPARQDGAVEDNVSPRTSFDSTELKIMVFLCFGSNAVPELATWMTQLDDLLSNKLGAVRFSDLRILRGETVTNMIDPMTHSKYASPVRSLRLQVLIDYARMVSPALDHKLTFEEMEDALDGEKRKVNNPKAQPTTATTGNGSMDADFDTSLKKVEVPKLPTFQGDAGEWHRWSNLVPISLGTAGLSDAITVASFAINNPMMAKRVFYALRAATEQGHAASLAKEMDYEQLYDPYVLWQKLTAEYDTEANKMNIALYLVRHLYEMKLDSSTTPSKFRSEFNDLWLQLKQANPSLAVEADFIRPVMLMAIHDDDYNIVREKIIAEPNKTVAEFLSDIRDRESILRSLNGEVIKPIDGSNPEGIRSRRTTHSNPRDKKAGSSSNGQRNPSKSSQGESSGPWNIPLFPNTWKNMVGKGVFTLMCKWRLKANGNNIDMPTLNKPFQVEAQGLTRNEHNQKKRQSDDGSTGINQSEKANQSDPKRVKYTLRETRRTITERAKTHGPQQSL
jgi:hypothetical protein